jgi:RNA polymerase sigma factor (TIGR02999 family)
MCDVTRILSQIDAGDPSAAEQLLPLVYEELRKLAAAKLAHEKPGQTLQATALAHEAYLRLAGAGQRGQSWDNRAHFLAAAAEAMRRILVENARRKNRRKRGGDLDRIELPDLAVTTVHSPEDLLSLDEALTALQQVDQQAAELVKLRYFTGLTLNEVAQALNISLRTANRTWAFARAWLYRRLHGTPRPAAN